MAKLRSGGAALLVAQARSIAVSESHRANPIRRVVTLLQQMQEKVGAEARRDEETFEKFMCYCSQGAKDLALAIRGAEDKIEQLTSALEEAKARESQIDAKLKTNKADRQDAKDAVAKATEIRNKEASAFARESEDLSTNVAALSKAIDAISNGGKAEFLQTSSAVKVRQLAIDMVMTSADRDMLSAFLSQGQAADIGYAPASGEILGVLKQMRDTMNANLAASKKAEEAAKAAFADLTRSKNNEIATLTKSVEDRTARLGQVGVSIVNLKNDLDDTSGGAVEDKKFMKDLDKNCATKKLEYDEVKKTRAQELAALADTIKILNDDDALELFKKTLPSPSLLQERVTAKETRSLALSVLESSHEKRLDLISLAIRGKKVSFDKVVAMIDEMTKVLKNEQVDDDNKKEFCEGKLDKAEDEQKVLEQDLSDMGKAIEKTKAAIETYGEEIAALAAGIGALDKSVAEATAIRKEENAEYKKVMAQDTAAKELLKMAKNRLYQFYNPKLYKPPPKKELSAQQRIAVSMGSEEASFVQVQSSVSRDSGAPPPPPEAVAPYQKKGEESAGVLSMVDLLIADLDKEMQEMSVEEKDSQADYDTFIADSAEKRTSDSKSIDQKESMKAEAEALLEKTSSEKKSKTKEAYANSLVIRDLHNECDWLLSNYDVRGKARAGELESLSKAKAILSGADYALVQAASIRRHLRG